ncbi:hypothetical protein ACSBR1_001222 [Camellia fascicularis]
MIASVKGVFRNTITTTGSDWPNSPSQIPETSSRLLGATPMQFSQAPRNKSMTRDACHYATTSTIYAFVVEEAAYNFSSLNLTNLQNRTMCPIVLDWSVGDQTCAEAKNNLTTFACKANSDCYDFDNDINECVISSPCNMTSQNLPGTYKCSCLEGCKGDGRKNGSGCSAILVPNHRLPLINIALAMLLLGSSWLYWIFRQRNIINLREKFFQKNGGIMLQRLSKHEGSVQILRQGTIYKGILPDNTIVAIKKSKVADQSQYQTKIFTVEDLKTPTINYHESRILGQGGQGTVYKGILPDNTIVAIKKPNVADQSQSQIEQFINEVIILSQVNHRNVVKLLGCCLETQVPLLVYDFITNGTLYDHIHIVGGTSSITWANRLRIAMEIAIALSYLHSAAILLSFIEMLSPPTYF